MKHRPIITALALLALTSNAGAEAERIGTATRILTDVNGDSGTVEVSEPIHRDERIRTSKSGLGEFVFRDGTKLAIGAGSVVKIDKFVFDGSQSVKKFTVRAAKGTFRWVSGNSKSSAYQIVTPAGTIGVRGTKFDFYVGPDGRTGVVLLSGSARFCGAGGCVQMHRKCDCVIAKPGQRPALSRASRKTLTALGNTRALPFLSGNQRLSGGFGASSGCGMSVAVLNTPDGRQPPARARSTPNRSQPSTRSAPSRQAGAPARPNGHNAPSTPDTPNNPRTPATPSNPGTPATPSNPGTPSAPSDPGTPSEPSDPGTPSKRGHGYGDTNHTHTHDR
jgi:hypothetical protein